MRNVVNVLLCLCWFFQRGLGQRFLTSSVEYWGASEVDLGQCFSVHCLLSVFDPHRWTRDGVPLNPGTPGHRFKEERTPYNQWHLTLEVDSAAPHLVGEFRCVTFNRQYHRTRIKGAVPKKPDANGFTLSQGQPLTLDCPLADGNDTIQWFKNGRELMPTSRVQLQGAFLLVQEADVTDAGEYLCWVGDSGNGHVIDVTHAAVVEQWPSTQTEIPQGGDVTFHCKVFGHPQPKVRWFVGNVLLSHLHHGPGLVARGPSHSQPEYSLHLSSAAATDQGLYTCRARNALGHTETSVYLRVKENSVVTNVEESSRELWVILGRSFVLQCNSTHQDLDTRVTWFRNDVSLTSSSAGIILFESNSSLLIPEAEESDMGEYLCVIFRPEAIDSARIFVQARMLTVSGESEDGNLVIIRSGHEMILHCNSTHSNWQLIWYKDGVLLTEERFQYGPQSLSLSSAKEEDAGDYVCVVRADQVQKLINASIAVRVAPEVKALAASETAKESFRWQLHCDVTAGVPDPSVLWLKDGVPVSFESSRTEADGESRRGRIGSRREGRSWYLVWEYLVPSDRGHYTCLAQNGLHGHSANTTTFLRVRSRWAALWPFLGICCELGALAATIFFSAKIPSSPTEAP